MVPTFNYFEVAENGEITSKGATEPTAIAIAGTACTNFAVGVYLKYKMSKDGAPTAAIFSIYYKTTQTFPVANVLASQLFAIVVRGDKDFEDGAKFELGSFGEGRFVGTTGGIGYRFGDYIMFGSLVSDSS